MISKWESLSKRASEDRIDGWENLPEEGFWQMLAAWKQHEIDGCPDVYMGLREKLVSAYEEIKEQIEHDPALNKSATKTYQLEYRYALRIYRILNEEGLTVRNASDDGVWRFLSIAVVPDIVYDRWKDEKKPQYFNPDRFYAGTRRIWLKILWWYVYLCWQGDYEQTEACIATNNANEISQLVERSGTGGYRVDLFRGIIGYYDSIPQSVRIKEKNLLSRVLQLNIARSQIIEPDLVPGGVSEYIKMLFAYFDY